MFYGCSAARPPSIFTVSSKGPISGSLAKFPSQSVVSSMRCPHLQESDQITIAGCSFVMAIEQRSPTLQRGQPTFASLGLLSAVWTRCGT